MRIVREYERGVIFRLGRLQGPKGPGLFFIIPLVDRMVKVNLQTVTLDIKPQNVITKDNVTVRVKRRHLLQRRRRAGSRRRSRRRRRRPREVVGHGSVPLVMDGHVVGSLAVPTAETHTTPGADPRGPASLTTRADPCDTW